MFPLNEQLQQRGRESGSHGGGDADGVELGEVMVTWLWPVQDEVSWRRCGDTWWIH